MKTVELRSKTDIHLVDAQTMGRASWSLTDTALCGRKFRAYSAKEAPDAKACEKCRRLAEVNDG